MKGVWLSGEMALGPLVFEGSDGRHVARCGVVRLGDESLQRLLDEAKLETIA